VGAALYCGRLVVATDEEFAREPSRLDEGLAMAPRKVDEQARRRYPCHNNTGRWLPLRLPRLGAVIPRRAPRPQRARTRRRARRLQPAASHATVVKLRVRDARAFGAALVACSRAASHCHSGQTRV
jgi:hypothetical protein